jgi:hypothetical protein
MSRKSGSRFSEKDMRQDENLERGGWSAHHSHGRTAPSKKAPASALATAGANAICRRLPTFRVLIHPRKRSQQSALSSILIATGGIATVRDMDRDRALRSRLDAQRISKP